MAHKLQPKAPIGYFDRTIKENARYANIRATIDTGKTVSKVKTITANEGAKRRAEIFFRLTPGQLCALYEEYESNENEDVREMGRGCYADDYGSGSGGPKIVTYDESAQAVNSKPYLILDVREVEEYRKGHLLQARSFPYSHMRRDAVHPEFYQFRNKPEALIILYCDDERVSRDAAKLFVDRGTDNIFLLSGGLGEFAAEYPFLVEGAASKVAASPVKRSGLTRSGEWLRGVVFFPAHSLCSSPLTASTLCWVPLQPWLASPKTKCSLPRTWPRTSRRRPRRASSPSGHLPARTRGTVPRGSAGNAVSAAVTTRPRGGIPPPATEAWQRA